MPDVEIHDHTTEHKTSSKASEYLTINSQTDLAMRIVEQFLPEDEYVRRLEDMRSRDILIRNFIESNLVNGDELGEGDITRRPYGYAVLNPPGAAKLAEFLSVTPEFKVERDDARICRVQCYLLQDGNSQMPYAGTGWGVADTIEGAKELALVGAIRSLTATDFLIEEYEAVGYESYLADMIEDGPPYKSFDEWAAWQLYG